jgi:hypothetical protein
MALESRIKGRSRRVNLIYKEDIKTWKKGSVVIGDEVMFLGGVGNCPLVSGQEYRVEDLVTDVEYIRGYLPFGNGFGRVQQKRTKIVIVALCVMGYEAPLNVRYFQKVRGGSG